MNSGTVYSQESQPAGLWQDVASVAESQRIDGRTGNFTANRKFFEHRSFKSSTWLKVALVGGRPRES
jgi:hypothetical protein